MIENSYNEKISEITTIDSGEFGFSTEEAIVNEREDLRKIIEKPCLPACLSLYDKNIQTVNSSANKRDIGSQAYIGINYDSLDESNKQILEQLVTDGIIAKTKLSDNPQQRGGRDIIIRVPVYENDTVGKVSDRFMQIISSFQEQDVLYGRNAVEPLMQEIIDGYSEVLHPDENGEVEFEEFKDVVINLYTGYVYDDELDIFWKNKDLYNKHKKFQEKNRETKAIDTKEPSL